MRLASYVMATSIKQLAIATICISEPRTRVALSLQSGVPASDYINANYIRVRWSV